jgi:HTH-type transcriptional regulator/antitoxin MqsA
MSISNTVCPVCEQGRLTAGLHNEEIRHDGATILVRDLEYCRCDTCGADPVLTEQIKRNQIRIADARRAHGGLLTCAEIRQARELAGISQADAARIFGGGTNAFSKYERGEVEQSVAMDRLLRIVKDFPGLTNYLASYAGVSVSAIPLSTGYVAVSRQLAVESSEYRKSPSKLTLVSSGNYTEYKAA